MGDLVDTLKRCCLRNDLNRAIALINEPEFPLLTDQIPQDSSVLHIAVCLGLVDTVEALLTKSFSDLILNYQDEMYGWTPLMHAIASGHFNMVNTLLATGRCNVEVTDKDGQSVLHIYAQTTSSTVDYAKAGYFLIKQGAVIDQEDSSKMTPFLRAIEANNLPAAKMFFFRRCDLYHANDRGHTAGHIAARHCRLDILEWLVRIHSPLNAVSDHLQTPLMLCVQQKRSPLIIDKVMRLCLQFGGDVNAVDVKGNTALLLAISNPTTITMSHIQLLLSKGADVSIANIDGLTPLWQAVYDGVQHPHRLEVISLLVYHNCSLDQPSQGPLLFTLGMASVYAYESLMTPLHVAVDSGYYSAARLLVQAGAKLTGLKPDFVISSSPDQEWLYHICHNARDLQEIVRIAIRKLLNRQIVSKVHQLPLPPRLKSYCLLQDMIRVYGRSGPRSISVTQ